MRFLATLILACPLAALAQQPGNDSRTLETLLSEVQQLRMAIERSTLLGARTQLAISQLQLQEGKVEKLSRDLASARELAVRAKLERVSFTEAVKDLESRKSSLADPKLRDQMEIE